MGASELSPKTNPSRSCTKPRPPLRVPLASSRGQDRRKLDLFWVGDAILEIEVS